MAGLNIRLISVSSEEVDLRVNRKKVSLAKDGKATINTRKGAVAIELVSVSDQSSEEIASRKAILDDWAYLE